MADSGSRRRGNGPGSLYAAMIARPVDGTLNRDTRPTKREHLLEVFLVAILRSVPGHRMPISREDLMAADDLVEEGLRVQHRWERRKHVVLVPDPVLGDQTDSEQQTLAT